MIDYTTEETQAAEDTTEIARAFFRAAFANEASQATVMAAISLIIYTIDKNNIVPKHLMMELLNGRAS